MKIQINQKGQSFKSDNDICMSTGVLLVRRGHLLEVTIGNRASPAALFSAMSHIRSFPFDIIISSKEPLLHGEVPLGKRLDHMRCCYFIGSHLIEVIEKRHPLCHTSELSILTALTARQVPLALQDLTDLSQINTPTASVLAKFSEERVRPFSFIVSNSQYSFQNADYRVVKVPSELAWPTSDMYIPLPWSELLTHNPLARWYNSLCHVAFCTRRPLLHICQMKLALHMPPHDERPAAPLLQEPEWHQVTRILYPMASIHEKPSNYRLLIGAIISHTDQKIL